MTEIDTRAVAIERIARTLIGLAILTVAVMLLRLLADVMLLVFAAALVATVLRGAAEGLGRRLHLSPNAALGVMLLAIALIVGLAIWLRGPAIVHEIEGLGGQIADQAKRLRGMVDQVPWGGAAIAHARTYLAGIGEHVAGMIGGVATGTLGALGSLVVLVVSAIYFATSPALYVRGTLKLMPKSARARGGDIMSALAHTLRWWFIGQAVDMLVVGTLTAIGLFLIGVPLWGTLALIAALFNFVPYIGALAGAVPALLVAIGSGSTAVIEVAALFLAVQSLEGNVVAPIIQKSTVELPPVVTILSQTVLGTLFGPLGLILATPMTAAGMVLVRMIYVEDILDDHGTAADTNGKEPTDT